MDHSPVSTVSGNRKFRVLIVGGGIGGLCLAQGLNKAGIEAQVFERQASAIENLAGYGLHIDENGRRALHACLTYDNWTQLQSLFTSAGTQMFFRDTQLQSLALRDDAGISGRPTCEVERSGIGRLELRDVLLNGLTSGALPTIRWNKAFTHYQCFGTGGTRDGEGDGDAFVRLYFADGTFEDGDVLVGADGPNSKVRKQYLPDIERLDLGIVAIAGPFVLGKEKLDNIPTGMVDGSLNNIVPYGKGWMFFSTWQSRPAYVEQRQVPGERCEEQSYVVWAYVVPQVDTPAEIEQLSELALQRYVLRTTEQWSPAICSIVGGSDLSTIKLLPLRSMPPLSPWTATNVTVLGDAIHNMTPMAGMGANTALRDSELLTRVLIDVAAGKISFPDAIGTYETEMRQYSNVAVAMSRRNAENASKGSSFQRLFFRGLLRAAQASPTIMRATLGRPAMQSS